MLGSAPRTTTTRELSQRGGRDSAPTQLVQNGLGLIGAQAVGPDTVSGASCLGGALWEDSSVSLGFEVRPSDTPLVDCVWSCRSSSEVGELVSVSSSHWHLVVGEIGGLTEVTVHGPETRATRAPVPPEAAWVGIRFRLGVVLHDLPVAGLVDRSLVLPRACHRSFWWKGTA